jgi:FkbM family methyltransferase
MAGECSCSLGGRLEPAAMMGDRMPNQSTPTEWSGATAPSGRATRELMGVGPFAFAGRIALAKLYASRWVPRGQLRVPLRGGGTVYLNRHTLESDFETLRGIFVPRKNEYATDYAGATVVDIGAHKGYYGAYALLVGASCVFSYEPASENYSLLDRAASSFRRKGMRWETRRAAVGAAPGSAVLHLSAESWTHSLSAALPDTGPARAASSEVVEVVAGETVLSEAAEAASGKRLIVKVDAEGAECEICLQTDQLAWLPVHELFVETHEFASCGRETLTTHLHAAGLEVVGTNSSVVHLSRRRRPPTEVE